MKKKIICSFFLICCLLNFFAFADIPSSVILLRDSMYSDPLNHEDLMLLYEATVKDVQKTLSGYDLYVALSRCAYYMGRSYAYAENKDRAAFYFDKGLEYAQSALDIEEGSEALLMYGENLSQNCAVKPTAYAIANGLKIGRYVKDILEIDPNNGAAMVLNNGKYIYAPAPFNNYKKGIQGMSDILATPTVNLEKDDLFNAKSALAYAHIRRKEYTDASLWIKKALAVYPTNFYALSLKEQTMDDR